MMRAWPLSWLRPRGMQARLTWGALVLVLAALGVLGGYTAHEQAQISRRATLAEASALAHNVALSAADPVLTNSLDVLEDLALRAADVGEVRALAVLRPDGRTLVRVLRQPQAAAGQRTRLQYDPPSRRDTVPLPGAEAHWLEADDHLVAWQPVQAGGDLAWVRLDVGLQAMHETRQRIWRNTAVVACVAALACALLTWWGLRRPMRLLGQATGFARALADASGRQLPRVPAPQEIEELTDALNEASLLLCQQMILLEDNLGAMQSQKARLAEQHGQLAAIFAHSHDGLVTFDRAGRLQFVNQAFLGLTGLSEAALQGHDLAHLDTLLCALSDAQRPWAGLLAPPPGMAEADAPGAFNAPLVLHLAGDPRRVLSITCERHREGPVGALVYACDVTRQHRLDEMKSEFLSMAAHELRTPMVSIFGFTELMLKREMSAEQRQDLLGRIHRHSQSMVSILNELLDLARIEARRGQDLVFEEADLADVVSPVLRDCKPPEGRELPAVLGEALPMSVRVDRHKLQQAVLNVLSNAYKYSPNGGPVTVRYLDARCTPDAPRTARWGVAIEDQGMGMSAEHLARLGERFFRADKSGNIPGTGLGMSIVKELLHLMGGHMQVRSVLGQGTTVVLWL